MSAAAGDLRDWLSGPVLEVAPRLLGALLTTRGPDGEVTLRLTEVEAYDGENDPGSHAFRGRSARNAVMYGPAGRLYVYRHLGLHHCVNVVTGAEGVAAAVLLRAGEVVEGVEIARRRRVAAGVTRSDVDLARGPARLTVALGIDREWNGAVLRGTGGRGGGAPSPLAMLRPGAPVPAAAVRTGPRVGVSGLGGSAEHHPWRFWLAGEPTVSDYRAATTRARRTPASPGTAH